MESVNVRNLEQIQESDSRKRSSRLGTLLLASMGGAALVIVAVMSARRSGPPARSPKDPLAALVADAKKDKAEPAEKLDGRDVTFPGILSDDKEPTTALAAVKDAHGRLVKQSQDEPAAPSEPPPAADKLPVVPLPAGSLLSETPVTTQPKDQLTELAADASKVANNAELAPEGSPGGYQIQVASFKNQADADAFVADLRRRGHEAYRQAAYVNGKGLWHRVRIGPFKTKFAAEQYKKKLETKERVASYVIDPHVEKLMKQIHDAKLAARVRKYGRP
jgi:cell division septation protein DedD